MLVSVRARASSPSLTVHLLSSPEMMTKSKVTLAKSQLDSCIQMLHKNEKSMLLNTPDLSLSLTNDGGNNFTLRCMQVQSGKLQHVWVGQVSEYGTNVYVLDAASEQDTKVHPSVRKLLGYMSQQLLPVYKTACTVSENMQTVFGSLLTRSPYACSRQPDQTFMRTNSCTISKLTDMLNLIDARCSYSPVFATRLAWLAAVFCSTAPSSKTFSLFNVSQLQMADMSEYMVERLYERSPEKQHLSVLMRNESAEDRIKRFNVAVRIFPADCEFTKDLMPQVISLNAVIHSPVMVVSGVRNSQAAAIYLSSESLSETTHCLAMHTYLCGPNTGHPV